MSRPGKSSVIVAAVVSALLLGAADSAPAAIECRYDPGTRVLSVDATEKNLSGSEAEMKRVGEGIGVWDEFSGHRVRCHGSPTVTNTDRVKLRARGYGTSISISLVGGPFAPGATPESDASPEIEMTLAGTGSAFVAGGPETDHFTYMTAAGKNGINLDASPEDQDIDLFIRNPRTLLLLEGGPGPDTVDVLGRTRMEVDARGGTGNDILSALGSPSGTLEGEAGADQLIGSAHEDTLQPGPGADQVRGEGGDDEIDNPHDGAPDSIDCGAGSDFVVEREPRDSLLHCEKVVPKAFG